MVLGAAAVLGACGKVGPQDRIPETAQELQRRDDAEYAASPDVRIPELRDRLRRLGISVADMKPAIEENGVPILKLTFDAAKFERIDKPALAALLLDSRYRFELADAALAQRFASFAVAEINKRHKARALRELAQMHETDRIPRYRPGTDIANYARSLESYCGYGRGQALRVRHGKWLEYNPQMAMDGAIAASKGQSWAPFACVTRVVYATDLGRHFIGNRGRQGATDS